MTLTIALLGGGDLASGVALRLFHSGLQVVITELPQPTMVRRLVSFAEAMYQGEFAVEGVIARDVSQIQEAMQILQLGKIPVIEDAHGDRLLQLRSALPQPSPLVVVDARMRKLAPDFDTGLASLLIGLGPGFIAGENCDAVVETNRGHFLGRVIWDGAPQKDTGIPDKVNDHSSDRVLRSPASGELETFAHIGDYLHPGEVAARVAGQAVVAPFKGVLRGPMHPGLDVSQGTKIGDVDPRNDPRYCMLISDKSLAIGGSVLEAILSMQDLRPYLWG